MNEKTSQNKNLLIGLLAGMVIALLAFEILDRLFPKAEPVTIQAPAIESTEGSGPPPEIVPMPMPSFEEKHTMIGFDGVDDYINFGIPSGLSSLGNKVTIIARFVKGSSSDRFTPLASFITPSPGQNYGVAFYINASNYLAFIVGTTSGGGNYGAWRTNTTITNGQLTSIAMTMDMSSVSNDPVLYIDGQSITVVEDITPTGSFRPDYTNRQFDIGRINTGPSYDYALGTLVKLLVYDEILTAVEIQTDHESRVQVPIRRNLVFAPRLEAVNGGLATGASMSAGNTVPDMMSTGVGTPSGSPTYLDNTYLSLGGE